MQATTEFLYQVFDTYNERCFNSQLKRPHIILNRSKRQLGLFTNTRSIPIIKVSNYYDRSEADYIDTLVHEMIHYYTRANKLKDTSPHGKLFKALMKKINEQENLHISVTTSASRWKPFCTNQKTYTVLFLELEDGRHLVTVVGQHSAYGVECKLQRVISLIKSHRWYRTTLPEYDSYPNVRSLRGRLVDEQEFNRQIEQLEALVASGKAETFTI